MQYSNNIVLVINFTARRKGELIISVNMFLDKIKYSLFFNLNDTKHSLKKL